MTSNTKLTGDQKNQLKMQKVLFRQAGGQLFSFPDAGMTIAIRPAFVGANTVMVSTSIQSPDEAKFRVKVGEFNALERMEGLGQVVLFPMLFDMDFEDFAGYLAGYF